MRARTREAPPGAGADFGIERGLVGIGEPVVPAPGTVAEAVCALSELHGAKAGRMLRRFAELPAGTLVWTQAGDRTYRLGSIAGVWRYDSSPVATELGITHVRPAIWSPRRHGALDVPAGVARTFARGGRNLQRIHDPAAERLSARQWAADENEGPAAGR
jgi:hypothetical protein